MDMIFRAAVLIGASTLIGTFCGFLLNNVSPRWCDAVTAFAAGVMLCAAMFGLFQPAMEAQNVPLIVAGTIAGMAFLRICPRILPGNSLALRPELMFVAAIALHKFPEGMAGGVGLASEAGMMVALGVAIQNLPEGVVMIPPLLNGGVKRPVAAMIALLTGLLNVLGVYAGALWGSAAGDVLPFALAFAAGAMLDVILRNMIPQIFASKHLRRGEWIIMGGFLIMAAVNMLF